MRWVVFVLLMIACLLLVICYSLCVIASQADEEEEKFYKEWQAKPKVEPKEVVTTCVSVPVAILEANEKEMDDDQDI